MALKPVCFIKHEQLSNTVNVTEEVQIKNAPHDVTQFFSRSLRHKNGVHGNNGNDFQ